MVAHAADLTYDLRINRIELCWWRQKVRFGARAFSPGSVTSPTQIGSHPLLDLDFDTSEQVPRDTAEVFHSN
jgi:hypothetical protein